MTRKIKLLIISIFSVAIAACGGDDNSTTVYDIIKDSEVHNTLELAIDTADLDSTLDSKSSDFTVFAPTDSAFEALGADTINALLADPDALADILLYHVLSFEALSTGLSNGTVDTVGGGAVNLAIEGTDVFVNFALVVQADLIADNGVVHVIDAVLLEPDLTASTSNVVETAVADGRFTTLVAALEATGLDATLADENGSFTVFAPTDDAFAMLPTGTITALLDDTDALSAVLLQHVISGAQVDSVTALSLNGAMAETAGGAMIDIDVDFGAELITVGGAHVVITDIVTSNGIIHVIDAVIVGDLDVPQPSIVDVAEELGGFTTLLAALEETGLDAVLDDLDETYTVFAPTDAAFDELGSDAIAGLLADPDTLSDILLYHVIPEATILADAAISVARSDMSKVATANGDQIALSYPATTLFVNTSAVTTPNVMASNGVIHVIDQVLTPPAEMGSPTSNIVETAIAAGNFTTLVNVLGLTDLDLVLSDEAETYTVFAPTDAAFDLIPDADLEALVADIPALTQVLLQHVISGAAVDSVTAFTLNGTSVNTASTEADGDVSLNIVDGVLEVQGSAISTYDIYTNNGVIHVIDAVITETLN